MSELSKRRLANLRAALASIAGKPLFIEVTADRLAKIYEGMRASAEQALEDDDRAAKEGDR